MVMKIAVVGLGYAGLPLAVELGEKYPTVGVNLSAEKIAAYRNFRRTIVLNLIGVTSDEFLS